jgi:hypothetical protein
MAKFVSQTHMTLYNCNWHTVLVRVPETAEDARHLNDNLMHSRGYYVHYFEKIKDGVTYYMLGFSDLTTAAKFKLLYN